ncbi:MAG TPA: phenylacetate--CoA ligase [Deltaproteobacteria bacterium]|nr:MAG: phenylacetate--CoA ligase [Deltaproteobacteria bacterium GWA2_65_63]OGP29250.1 MAG: phenylacetate--CoA ligase [Deltaproteobacteria bacterium GWB2_65_81]OGP77858.1 MAG: phenylacetate--CoA ligase [Deltaproteobacteria bacterium RBG_16_66_15]HAM33081.1 phenylacetate--CoA ligase [Deltaproteobacteria bacterium]HBG72564.1 phenylacetate--CoA ligase [Deltaproteobacteria bacterium]
MLKRFPPKYRTDRDLRDLQRDGLRWTVEHAWNNSPFYRKRLEEFGVTPDTLRSLDDLARIPFTTAEDLRLGYPLPLRSVPPRDIVRIHSSSGTTGKRKILCYTQKDIDDWLDMFGRCYEMAGLTREDRVQICVGYGLWTAGVGFQLGAERFGAMAIPSGPGNLELQCNFLIDLETTVLCCTASMGLLLAEEVHARGLRGRLHLKKVILGAERTSQAMLHTIRDLLGVREVYDIPGLTELYGPGTGLSCRQNVGIHYWSDYYILEILDPDTLVPVAPGEIGEMVYTTLRKEAAPLLRYRSRDLTRLIAGPCPCGCILPRHDKILGRSDDMVVFRGVNIYPGQVDEVLARIGRIGSEYQVLLERKADGKDHMTVKVELAADPGAASSPVAPLIASEIKRNLMVSCTVETVPYGSLPRSERKTKRVFDNRPV